MENWSLALSTRMNCNMSIEIESIIDRRNCNIRKKKLVKEIKVPWKGIGLLDSRTVIKSMEMDFRSSFTHGGDNTPVQSSPGSKSKTAKKKHFLLRSL